jgi:hypothetical protein
VTANREEHGPAGIDLARAVWRKSSYSGGNGSCVEVADLGDAVAVRDSKDKTGPKLIFSRDEWRIFLDDVRASTFDLQPACAR